MSEGTDAAAVFLTDDDAGFTYYAGKRLIAAFDPGDTGVRLTRPVRPDDPVRTDRAPGGVRLA
ncbi:hypothetical protein E1286_33885 [Nonomuraea terrae]|uniref:Uncharacterized protein n=1 Tax=Nonomuraea terrae TaxID=2530383 RepID=A0A4R4YCD1_9ACTN|nr:hypothetical protein [Nonomuraea terrae]TDD40832.1 hypothetical protein E1286_33885 [Nonomuraea terrae]